MSGVAERRWRNPTFTLVFLALGSAWLVVVGWVSWLVFNPATDWVGRQHEMLQELCGLLVFLPWLLFLAFGLGAAAHLAERAAGIGPGPQIGQTHGEHAKWTRPDQM